MRVDRSLPVLARRRDRAFGRVEQAPIRITRARVIGLENTCEIDEVLGPDTMGRYALRQTCTGEGMTYPRTTTLELQAGDSMVFSDLGGPAIRLFRCG